MFCGLMAIFVALNGQIIVACLLIIVGTIIDTLDGYIAHKTNTVSDFGANLDMLADLVTSGLAPALLLFVYYQNTLVNISAFILVICGAWRLARHNTHKPNNCFVGMPIDVCAYIVSLLVILQIPPSISALLILLLALLFVSRVKIPRLFKH